MDILSNGVGGKYQIFKFIVGSGQTIDYCHIVGELQDIKALNIEGGSEGEVLERLEGSVA